MTGTNNGDARPCLGLPTHIHLSGFACSEVMLLQTSHVMANLVVCINVWAPPCSVRTAYGDKQDPTIWVRPQLWGVLRFVEAEPCGTGRGVLQLNTGQVLHIYIQLAHFRDSGFGLGWVWCRNVSQ